MNPPLMGGGAVRHLLLFSALAQDNSCAYKVETHQASVFPELPEN